MDALISLGANGDICNALPIAYDAFRSGNRMSMMVSRGYAPLLDGVSYVNPVIFDRHYGNLTDAITLARAMPFKNIYVCQTYGLPCDRQTDSFAKEAWRVINRRHEWGSLPLVFDRRDKGREALLWAQIPTDKPLILVAHTGHSSPFAHRQELTFLLTTEFRDTHRLVDLSGLKCERLYDQLGLFERAQCLVTIDTAQMHLAAACPQLPVIALATDKPDLWHGSPRRCSHVVHMRYGEFPARKQEIVDAIRGLNRTRCIHHVWSDYQRHPDAARRHGLAMETWQREALIVKGWVSHAVPDKSLTRNSTSVGDKYPVPFVKDLIARAMAAARADDLILLTNDDTCLSPGLGQTLSNLQVECAYAHRHDFNHWDNPPKLWSILGQPRYPGADLFVFTRRWWTEHQKDYPDSLLARETWDLCMRELMIENGGIELHGACYHWAHLPFWSQAKTNGGNLYNVRLANQFLQERNMTVWDFR